MRASRIRSAEALGFAADGEVAAPRGSSRWRRKSLATQFGLAAALVIGIAMAVLGTWVAARIERGVIYHTSLAAALYMERFVAPHVQELGTNATLSEKSREALAELMNKTNFSSKVVDIRIWRPDGTVVYSKREDMIGQQFPVTEHMTSVLRGEIETEFDDLDDAENIHERPLHKHLLEIYAPIRATDTEKIIAIAEFYQEADQLAEDLFRGRVETGLVVGALSLLMLGALFSVVRRGSRTIDYQRNALNTRIAELSRLRQRLADASRRSNESNEDFLRRVSADLHDGPVQLVGLALLRLDGVDPRRAQPERIDQSTKDFEVIRDTLKDALCEIRDLSNGLALPELENLPLGRAVELAAKNHERRSGTEVIVNVPSVLPNVPLCIKTCAYRFVQEGLNNAFRHAGGAGQRVSADSDGCKLLIQVSDDGPGIGSEAPPSSRCGAPLSGGLGLVGLRDRIEALGGAMAIASAPGAGTRIQAEFGLIFCEVDNVTNDSCCGCR